MDIEWLEHQSQKLEIETMMLKEGALNLSTNLHTEQKIQWMVRQLQKPWDRNNIAKEGKNTSKTNNI